MKKLRLFAAALAALCLMTPAGAVTVSEQAALDGAEVDESVFLDGDIAITADALTVEAPSAILMERETGAVIWEKNADERLRPASVTKVMTMLLIAEAIDSGTLTLDEAVSVSARASGMGGSQVFLSEGEALPVRDMLKCIAVSSANDAAVAMAEHIAGTEEAFVAMMNARTEELGMENTTFTNCTGLFDDPAHLTTARDIAIMSRELIGHRWLREYTTIWMDTIRDGAFGLSNTNKLIRYYPGATGLKTGFTSAAGYCLSATAERDGVEYIAVVMNCQTSAQRFDSAKTLLSFAFANYTLLPVTTGQALPPIPVRLGKTGYVQPVAEEGVTVLVRRNLLPEVERQLELAKELTAPVEAGQEVGRLSFTCQGEEIASLPILAEEGAERAGWSTIFSRLMGLFFFGDG